MKTGNTRVPLPTVVSPTVPQWSPVMKTGNTCRAKAADPAAAGLNGARS